MDSSFHSGKAAEFPDEVVNALAFFEDFLHYSKLSKKVKTYVQYIYRCMYGIHRKASVM
jgi:hypothetical protein